MSGEDAERIRSGATAGEAFAKKLGVPAFAYDIVAEGSLETIVAAYVRAFNVPESTARQVWAASTALAAGRTIMIYTGARGWSESSPVARQKIVAHELFHVVQSTLAPNAPPYAANGDPNVIPPGGPTWLREGTAELVAYAAVADAGLGDLAAFKQRLVSDMKLGSPGVALQQIATQGGSAATGGATYSVGPVAVDYLVRGRGLGAIVDFYRRLGAGTSWQAAFEGAFGVAIDAFYSDFETYRRGL